jgi:hypothetical protein
LPYEFLWLICAAVLDLCAPYAVFAPSPDLAPVLWPWWARRSTVAGPNEGAGEQFVDGTSATRLGSWGRWIATPEGGGLHPDRRSRGRPSSPHDGKLPYVRKDADRSAPDQGIPPPTEQHWQSPEVALFLTGIALSIAAVSMFELRWYWAVCTIAVLTLLNVVVVTRASKLIRTVVQRLSRPLELSLVHHVWATATKSRRTRVALASASAASLLLIVIAVVTALPSDGGDSVPRKGSFVDVLTGDAHSPR